MRKKPVLYAFGALVFAYALYMRTDAYHHGNRLFYRDRRPNAAGRVVNGAWSWVMGLGVLPSFLVSLETVGRRSGKTSAVPVVVADYEGERYLVSMLGERSAWVKNIRASGGHAVLKHGRRRDVMLQEVPPDQRAPIIKVYVRRAEGARPHIPVSPNAPVEDFAAIAPDYPVFRILNTPHPVSSDRDARVGAQPAAPML